MPVKWRPTVRFNDETAMILTAIQAGIENLVSVTAEKYKPVYIPAPLTAHDRMATRAARAATSKLAQKLWPTKT